MRVVPSGPEVAKQSGLGAEVFLEGEDINNLDDEASAILRDALHDHGVIVIRKAEGLEPSTLPKLVKMWDPAALPFHGHGKTAIKDKNSVLHKNMAQRIPSAPQVQILGNGMVGDYLGFENLQLHHVVCCEGWGGVNADLSGPPGLSPFCAERGGASRGPNTLLPLAH